MKRLALRMMLSRGCANMESSCECERCRGLKNIARETARHAKKAKHKLVVEAKCHAKIAAIKANRRAAAQESRYDCCRGCCNEKVLKALAEVAFGKDDQCCWIEPSERVREAAAEGMQLCQPPGDVYNIEPAVPAVETPADDEEMKPTEDKEVEPAPKLEVVPDPKSTALPPVPISQTSARKALPTLAHLTAFCHRLKQRQFNVASKQFSSVFGHTYYFASREAKSNSTTIPRPMLRLTAVSIRGLVGTTRNDRRQVPSRIRGRSTYSPKDK